MERDEREGENGEGRRGERRWREQITEEGIRKGTEGTKMIEDLEGKEGGARDWEGKEGKNKRR